jgi:hypothetical protein
MPTCLVPRSTLDSSNTRTVAVCSQDADANPYVANASVIPATFAIPTRVTIVPSSSDRLADVVHSMDIVAPQDLRLVSGPVHERTDGT